MDNQDWLLWLVMANGIHKGWPRLNKVISVNPGK
jgi:hypothetical protein